MKILLLITSLALLFLVGGCNGDDGEVAYNPFDVLSNGEDEDYFYVTDDRFEQSDYLEVDLGSDLSAWEGFNNTEAEDIPEALILEEIPEPTIILNEEGVLEIADDDLSARIQEIQYHRSHFIDLTFRYRGMFLSTDWGDDVIFFVAQLGGGCCGFYGFEVYLNDIPPFDDETWVEVTGILEEFRVEGDERTFLRLNVISLYEA